MGMVRVQRVNQQGPWGDKESCEAGDWEDKGKYPRVMVVASQEMAILIPVEKMMDYFFSIPSQFRFTLPSLSLPCYHK